jgi:hypothetical protein
MDKLRVYLMKANKTFDSTISEVSDQRGNSVNSDLMSLSQEKEMSQNTCVMCKRVYDTKDITIEQKIVIDEAFCPICWHKEITAFSDDDMDFSFLEGLVK